jgi:splicing factor 3B subunit 2
MDAGETLANGAAHQSVTANGNNHVQHESGVPNPATASKINKKKEKRKKKKQKKKERAIKKTQEEPKPTEPEEKVEIDYVRQEETAISDPSMQEFAKVFQYFARPEDLTSEKTVDEDEYDEGEEGTERAGQYYGNSDSAEKPVLSKKARKRQKRLSIPLLKQLVKRPEAVEVHDVNSADPYFLVYLKSYRNSVPVPRHWSQKRKYLQGKRGIEKPPFQLPDFIAATGISRLRDAYQQKEDQKKLKQKQREKMQPKMGRVDIDYQVLHDAFFKFQTKPKLTIQGDLYYECKEFEVQLKEKRPGQLSDELKRALGMPEGAPPPWLINMQRYGPPTAYPNLKIPGLNAPIPTGASFGYHPGGWGKPPVNEFNQPLYGDVFGTNAPAPPPEVAAPIERTHWGELEEEEEHEEEEEAEEAEAEGEAPVPMESEEAEATSATQDAEIADGISSVPSGLETPDTIDLRKGRGEEGEPKLYQVLQQTAASTAGQMFGSSHKYIIGDKKEGAKSNRVDLMKSQKSENVNITLNPSEVEEMDTLSDDLLKKKYEQYIAEKADAEKGEDFSDMVAEQNKKRKNKAQKTGEKKDKKYKDYKF